VDKCSSFQCIIGNHFFTMGFGAGMEKCFVAICLSSVAAWGGCAYICPMDVRPSGAVWVGVCFGHEPTGRGSFKLEEASQLNYPR